MRDDSDDRYEGTESYGENDAYDDDYDDAYDDRDSVYDDDNDVYSAETYDDDYEDDDSWWDIGIIGTLLVAGILLFLFPEPFTSTAGIALITLGILAWMADALM